MTILNEKHKKWPIYRQLQKCGALTISKDFQMMGLNCFYCHIICTRLEEFARHLKKEHMQDVDSLYSKTYHSTTKDINIEQDLDEMPLAQETSADQGEQLTIKLEPYTYPVFDDDQQIEHQPSIEQTTTDHNDPFGDFQETGLDQVESVLVNEECNFVNIELVKSEQLKPAKSKSALKNPKTKPNKKQKNSVEQQEIFETSSSSKRIKSEKTPINYKESSSDIDDGAQTFNYDSDCESLQNHEVLAAVESNDEYETEKPQSTQIDIFAENHHDLVTHILQFYEKNPILWNVQHVQFSKANAKLNLLKTLAMQLEIRFQISLSAKELRRVFVETRRLYYNSLKKSGMDPQSSSYAQPWFQQLLTFLPVQREPSKNCHKLSPTLSVCDESLLTIAKVYEAHPLLWDVENEGYRVRNLKQQHLQQMHEQLQKLALTESELKYAITRMRNIFIAERLKRMKCEQEQIPFTPSHDKLYEQLQFLNEHIGPYRCTFDGCNIGLIRSYEKYKTHRAAHEGRKAFTCKHCQQDYSTFGNLEIHIRRRHTHETPFQCPFCEKSFTTSADLNTHKNIHQGVKPFICHLCGKGFPSSSYLSRHYMRHDPETYQYQCPQCPKKFCEKYRLREHLNSHMQLREHVCGICGKGFFAHKTLKQHEQLHSDETKYECSLCGKRFKQISAMYSHKKSHHNAVNFGEI